MWNNLFEYWKGLSFLGVISLPLVGLFFLTFKAINWSKEEGYHTRLKIFINRNSETSTSDNSDSKPADLVAEFPLKNLDRENYWKYCLPETSQLKNKVAQKATKTSQDLEKDCKLNWNNSSGVISHLLKLGHRFFKLKHQMNLLMLYRGENQVTQDNQNNFQNQISKKCGIDISKITNQIKDFFISTAPISDKCWLVPREVKLNLTLEAPKAKLTSTDQSKIELDSVKKATAKGDITYSLSSYYGELHKFAENNHPLSDQPITIEFSGNNFEFYLDKSLDTNKENKLDFEDFFKKYEDRDLKENHFWKKPQSISQITLKISKST